MTDIDPLVTRVDSVLKISTGEITSCPECGDGVRLGGDSDWTDGINHMLEQHNWHLLHVGGEYAADNKGNSIQFTVAVLGVIRYR